MLGFGLLIWNPGNTFLKRDHSTITKLQVKPSMNHSSESIHSHVIWLFEIIIWIRAPSLWLIISTRAPVFAFHWDFRRSFVFSCDFFSILFSKGTSSRHRGLLHASSAGLRTRRYVLHGSSNRLVCVYRSRSQEAWEMLRIRLSPLPLQSCKCEGWPEDCA